MLAPASLDALKRIADRANDVLAAYTPGAVPRYGDVNGTMPPLPSDDPLSVAAPPGTWFVTLDDRGARTYTRAGGFHVGADGTLQTVDGARVLGTPPGSAGVIAPLRLPEPDRTLGRCASVHLEDDGVLAYTRTSIDPRTRERSVERAIVGRVALARFPAGGNPQRIDATHFGAVAGVVPHLGAPADGGFAALATHARDAGNVDIDTGLERLSEAYVAFSALQAAHKAQGAGNKVVMDLLK
jgi:flagellar basal body rod protein FlgG